MDTTKRGTELVLFELCEEMSKRLAAIAEVYRNRPDEFGLSRHAEFVEDISTRAQSIVSLGSAYIAAERINGRK